MNGALLKLQQLEQFLVFRKCLFSFRREELTKRLYLCGSTTYTWPRERESESNETTFATSFEESVTTYQPAINLQLTPRRKV